MPDQRPRVRVDADLSRVLDGVEEHATILVTGPPSAGKSTEIAKLAVALGWETAWLDAEMNRTRVAEYFRRVGASRAYLRRVRRVGPPNVTSWRAAVEDARGAKLVVVDSLHNWAPYEADRQDLLRELISMSEEALVIGVQHWSQKGRAAGSLAANHRVAACVTVTRTRMRCTKLWWAPLGKVKRATRPGA